MKISILIPQYKETDDVVKPLLDSIAVQKGINFDDIEVIICNDGTDVKLSKKLLSKYSYKLTYITDAPHGGVSATRNRLLDAATGDYVMWCDADDMFMNVLGLAFVFELLTTTPCEILSSLFIEEVYDPQNNKYIYINRENDNILIHGKFFNRQWLIDNNIRWGDSLLVHEDSYFNLLAGTIATNMRYLKTPFYMWCWNPASVSRSDPLYIMNTYHHLIASATALVEELLRRDQVKAAARMFLINLYQTFYLLTGVYSQQPQLAPRITELNVLSKEYYMKFANLPKQAGLTTDEVDQLRVQMLNGAMKKRWYVETCTFSEWLGKIISL